MGAAVLRQYCGSTSTLLYWSLTRMETFEAGAESRAVPHSRRQLLGRGVEAGSGRCRPATPQADGVRREHAVAHTRGAVRPWVCTPCRLRPQQLDKQAAAQAAAQQRAMQVPGRRRPRAVGNAAAVHAVLRSGSAALAQRRAAAHAG
jgi:hypothetical protein